MRIYLSRSASSSRTGAWSLQGSRPKMSADRIRETMSFETRILSTRAASSVRARRLNHV